MISRSDNWPSTRNSITAVTSTWSDGTRGPLALCYAPCSLKQADVDSFNREFSGECFLFSSETKSHFMTGQTLLTLMHGILTDAFQLKRDQLQVGRETMGLLLADAWTGFHSHRSGLNHARAAWAQLARVKLPAVQVHFFGLK